MLRAYAEAAEVSSEASRPLDNQRNFGVGKVLAMCSLRDFSEDLEMTLPKQSWLFKISWGWHQM